MANERVLDLIPFVHVADGQRSIGFYEKLGFTARDTHEHDTGLDWAALESSQAQLMVARATAPVEADQQAVLFYLYSKDLADLREHLVAEGVAGGAIREGTPGPRREMALTDPDGYCLMIAQIQE